MKLKLNLLVALVMIASLALAACQPQVVEKTVVVTQEVEVPVEVSSYSPTN